MSLMGTPAFAQGAAAVRVDPSTSSVQANNTTNVAIKADNISNLIAFELHLSFNPSILEVTGLSNGGFVAADFVAQNVFDNAAGTIDYAVAQMNRPPAQGSGTLLNITFRAKAEGSSTVTTRATPAAPSGLILSDANGMAISASWAAGTIDVGTSTSVTNTPASTFTPAPTSVTTTPTNPSNPTATPAATLCEDDDSCPPSTATPTAAATNTPTPITHTPTYTFTSTSTYTPTFTPTPIPNPSDVLGIHIVRWGEWLYCIGRAYGVSPWAIAKTNGIWWPYIIFPYQKLTIPNVPWIPVTPGRVCKAQFTRPAPTPIPPTPNPVTPVVTVVPTATPTVTPTVAANTPLPSCRAIYIVRAGDTLFRIAMRYGTNYMELARVNGIPNPRLIYPGQQLCIP